jgi:hypothetical protein
MKILKATYGDKDVTDIVTSKVNNDNLIIQASNSIFGDPCVGKIKKLIIDIEIDGVSEQHSIQENSFIKLPKTKQSRLGIFYSNNNEDRINPCILKSLECIKRSSEGKADIITNLWNSLGDKNPFLETISWTRTSSHLNQVLQILQCLYMGKTIGSYKYVSFLEHDVLYPEGYFDYEDFDLECISNSNYIGLCNSGFQSKNANHQPLSQITMRMDFAIQHFESLLPNAIFLNSGLLEPLIKIGFWKCHNPSIHVNHGRHFTSHYSIYSKYTTSEDSYWGHYNQYSDLFFNKD